MPRVIQPDDINIALTIPAIAGVLVAALALLKSSAFYKELTSPRTQRYGSLDGFRGILAVSVVLHHITFFYSYFRFGVWEMPENSFFLYLGRGSVAFFFMITGFLFWAKAIENEGVIRLSKLMISRTRRIMPAYFISFLGIMCIAAWQSHGELHQSASNVALQVSRWLLGGLAGNPPINALEVTPYNAGVTWTLRYEWLFYICLPFIAPMSITFRRLGVLISLFIVCFYVNTVVLERQAEFYYNSMNFIWGMIAANIHKKYPHASLFDRSVIAWGSIVLLVIAVFTFGKVELPLSSLLFMPAFCCIIYGRFFPKILNWKPVIALGHISYSLYLYHGTILFVCYYCIYHGLESREISTTEHWLLSIPLVMLVVVISSFTYRYIEHPWISSPGKKKKVTLKLIDHSTTLAAKNEQLGTTEAVTQVSQNHRSQS